MKKPGLHSVLFVIIMGVLCLPLAQNLGKVFKIKDLEGYTESVDPVKLSWNTFQDGQYQEYVKNHLHQNFGFRNIYIRAYNQLEYSFFHQTTNHNIIIGKQGELYLKQYTDVFTGKTLQDTYGSEDSARKEMRRNVEETCRIIDSLKQFGTDLIVILAPSKPLIYPEFLPDQIQRNENSFSIQEEYADLYAKAGVEHINFVPIFRKLKKESHYPVYTKFGTHWAYSTMPCVMDTILQKIASVKGYPMPHIVCTDSNLTSRYRGSDRELEGQLNLLFPLRHTRQPDPKCSLQGDDKMRKPNLLVVGDSYFTQLEKTDFVKAFAQVDYWKYNREAFSSLPERHGTVPFVNRYEIITQADVILLVFTDMHAFQYFFDFIRTVDQTLAEGPGYDSEEAIQNIIYRIKATPEWYEKVVCQAEEKHISVEQALRDNAVYVFEQEHLPR